MSPFWQQKFGLLGFWKIVNPCSNFSPIPYTGYSEIPKLTCYKQVSNLFAKEAFSSEKLLIFVVMPSLVELLAMYLIIKR
jgi:hypothetical protein